MMMGVAWLSYAIIWSMIILCLLIGLIYWNIKLFRLLIARNKLAQEHIKMVKKNTEMQYNKIAALSPSDLDAYLIKMFSMCIMISSDTDVSERDPEARDKLYAYTATRMLKYLGNDTVDAIEYYYGEGFIIRWCEMRYNYLHRNNKLGAIISSQNNNADSIASDLK